MTKNTTIFVALLVCLLAAWIYSEKKSAQAVRPPAGGTNLVEFLKARPEASKIHRFVHNGKVHLQVVGKPSISPLSLPSGPPGYIFDEAGTLVDWCGDLGDNSSFVSKWGGFSNATSISAEEARQLVKTNEH